MAEKGFICAAQLNSSRAALDRLGLDGVIEAVHQAAEAAGIDILVLGGEEIPELYQALTGRRRRMIPQVFLWYAALADHPGLQPGYRVVNSLGERSLGWGSIDPSEEIGENFRFGCPNHPEMRRVIFDSLERQLKEYPFEGVFLDKIRFPSPANGLEEVFSCFCPFCRAAAKNDGLDLGAVQGLLARLRSIRILSENNLHPSVHTDWLANLMEALAREDQEILARALRFRARSITRLVEEIRALTRRMGVELALDLFSPGLAALVGQDYSALADLADWVKPMIYRRANGPAGLRLEISCLARGLEELLSLRAGETEGWMRARVSGMEGMSLAGLERDGPPLAFLSAEARRGVELMGATPVYLGVEAVSLPAFDLNISPEDVREMVRVAHNAGARGVVLSWDLLEMPLENLRAAGEDESG
jgi:hypothetical protein